MGSLESKQEEVKNPTAWIKTAAKKAIERGGGIQTMAFAPVKGGGKGGDADAKIRKTVGWWNKNGNLQDQIRYNEVAPLLMQLGASEACKILKGLEGKEADIKNPTG